jgi:DNA-binding IscR family transcriptional regulator
MRAVDRQTLEFLLNEGNRELKATPAVIAENTGYDREYVRQRMRPLRETRLIEYVDADRGMYALADRGRRYVTGEMTEDEAAELDKELASFSG